MKVVDISGEKIHRWTVLNRAASRGGRAYWNCICECGEKRVLAGYSLRSGQTKSCGCYSVDNPSALKHGKNKTRIHRIWSMMKTRCYNKKWHGYKHYGGKGIVVCDDWLNDFRKFNEWALCNGYKDNLTIDRVDTSKGYCPENCRWVSTRVQSRNRGLVKLDSKKVSEIKKLLASGDKKHTDIAEAFNVCQSTIQKINTGLLWGDI